MAGVPGTGHHFPTYRRDERAADAAVHAAGLLAVPFAGAWLLLGLPDGAGVWTTLAIGAYALGMAGMVAASAAYNLAPPGPGKERLRRLDHAMVFAAIAGTYTPLLALRLPDPAGAALCAAVWAVALAGIWLKLAAPRRRERLGLALYLGLGWVGLPALPWLAGALRPDTGWWVLAGGLLYTAGVGFHLAARLRFHNAAWHAFVLAAAACHWRAMWLEFAAG